MHFTSVTLGHSLLSKDNPPPAAGVATTRRFRVPLISRGDMVFVVVLVLLSALSWYPRRQGPLDLRWDGSVYYVLGTSLAEGKGYSLLNEPGEIRANQYPPLLPLIIAAHEKAAGTNDPFVVGAWLKFSAALWSTVVLVAAYLLLRRLLPPLWARCAAIMYLLSLPAYLHFSMLTAELPFTVALLIFFTAHYRLDGGRREAVSGVAAAAAFFARSVGVTLYAAWIGEAVLRRQFKRAAIRSAAAAICVLPWYGYVHYVELSPEYRHPAYPYQRADYIYYNVSYARNMTYVDPYRPELGKASRGDLFRRVMWNFASTPGAVGEAVTSYRNFWIGQSTAAASRAGIRLRMDPVIDVILFTIGSGVLVGIFLMYLRGHLLLGLYVLASLVAVASAPWPLQHVRYLSPSIPVLLPGLFVFLNAVRKIYVRRFAGARRAAEAACMGFVILIIMQQALTYFQSHTKYLVSSSVRNLAGSPVVYRQLFYYPENVAMDDCINWISRHAEPADIVAASMAHWVYLRTGLKTVMPPLEPDAVAANTLLDAVPVRFIIQETPSFYDFRYVANAIKGDGGWRLVYVAKADDVRVYERALRRGN